MIINILTNLILPKYLSINTYADIKTFQLCLSYIGVLHLGYNDGVYLKYGGKNISDLNKIKLSRNATTIKFMETAFFLILLLAGVLLGNKMLVYVSFVLVPYLLIAYYRYMFQALGEFSIYGRILNSVTIALFVSNMVLIILKIDIPSYYIVARIFIYYLVWMTLEIFSTIRLGIQFKFSLFSPKELIICIKQGFLLMLGNFASTFITSMDRWFIKILMTSAEFAYYSFAVSLESFLNVATTPITTTLYNYFCKDSSVKTVSRIRKYMVMFSSIIVSSAFAVKVVILWYLPKYKESVSVVFILFASQIFYIMNRSIYTNLYKAKKKQNRYFVKLLVTLVCAFILNAVCFKILHIKEAFAIGTLISAIIWFVIVNRDFRKYKCSLVENLFLVTMTFTLLLLGTFLNAVAGFAIYAITYIILGYTLMPDTLKGIIYIAKDYSFKMINKFRRIKG